MVPVLVIHNVRSAHNVGSLLRTANGLGLERVICSGYTPYPKLKNDSRLPHQLSKASKQIAKTSLGAEHDLNINHSNDIDSVIADLRAEGYAIIALEQNPKSISLAKAKMSVKLALIVGNEVSGVEDGVLTQSDVIAEIPMKGTKESFNVAVAGALAMYECTSRKD